MIKELKEMMIIKTKTCDAIDPMTLKEHNPHYEYYTILELKKDTVKLYNLSYGNTVKHQVWFVKRFFEKGETL